MDKKMLEKPKNIVILLMKLETNGSLSNMFVSLIEIGQNVTIIFVTTCDY
jgi:hypothetical protein